MDVVSDLNRFLAEVGEDIVLRRSTGTNPQVNYDVTVRAAVRLIRSPDVMVSDTTQGDLHIVHSMTEIRAANWPGVGTPGAAPFIVDLSIPRRGDKVIVKGQMFRVENVNAIAVSNTVVRVVLLAKGGASGG